MVTYSDIEPALREPGFDARSVIVVMDLPELRACKSMPLAEALKLLALGLRSTPTQLDQCHRQLERALAMGLTPALKVSTGPDLGCIELESFRLDTRP